MIVGHETKERWKNMKNVVDALPSCARTEPSETHKKNIEKETKVGRTERKKVERWVGRKERNGMSSSAAIVAYRPETVPLTSD